MDDAAANVDVFISYQRGERDAVAIIAQRLLELRVVVWFDHALRPGGAFDEEIANRLSAARAVLTCWTPAAMASDWVRAEAAMARQSDKLVACLLEPVQLLPPFNVIHAEDLTTWAGQEDDPAWLKLLDRMGDLLERPGLSRYSQVMAADASLDTLRQWALDNGDDPLVDTVWHRIHLCEGEDQSARIERERAEAAVAAKRRRAQAERSRELAKARGVRSGQFDRTLLRRILVATGALALIVLLAAGYYLDDQRRRQALDAASSAEALYSFLADNHWHPVATEARRRFDLQDATAWAEARTVGSLPAIESYLKRFSGDPAGAHLAEAQVAHEQAELRREAQRRLARLGVYAGAPDGGATAELRQAIQKVQYNVRLQVTGEVDERLLVALDGLIAARVASTPGDLRALRTGPPTIDDYQRIAARLRVDALVLPTILAVESKGRGFGGDGRPVIRFETHIFRNLTQGRFDASHGELSKSRVAAGQSQAQSWTMLHAAFTLAPQEAYAATNFGMFGIMGTHARRLGFETPAELARFLSESEANQVEAFARFVETAPERFLDALRTPGWNGFDPGSWDAFARSYNGPLFARNRYHEKLALAYRHAAVEFGIPLPAGLSKIANEGALQPQPRVGGRTRAIELQALGEVSPALWTAAVSIAGWAVLVLPLVLALFAKRWRRRTANRTVASGASAVPCVSRGWALTAGGGLLAASLVPPDVLPFATAGPAAHLLGFAVLASLVQAAGLAPHRLTPGLLLWAACALGVEAAQAVFTSTRAASPADALASLLGAIAGMAAIRWRGGRHLPLAIAALLLAAPLLTAGMATLRPMLTDALVRRAWAEAQQWQRPASPWPGAAADAAFALELPGAGLPVVVVNADGPAALALAPGLSAAGADVGAGGLALIQGHRNAAFAALEGLVEGQHLQVRRANGTVVHYVVSKREIVRWNRSGLVSEGHGVGRDELVLATCWPVLGRAPTPLRLVVHALRKEG